MALSQKKQQQHQQHQRNPRSQLDDNGQHHQQLGTLVIDHWDKTVIEWHSLKSAKVATASALSITDDHP
jgi:hypothetical protein